MSEFEYKDILEEIKEEQQIPSFSMDGPLKNYLKEGVYFLNSITSTEIDFGNDMNARSLLKNYVFYANHGQLDKFMEVYQYAYIELQIKYTKNT